MTTNEERFTGVITEPDAGDDGSGDDNGSSSGNGLTQGSGNLGSDQSGSNTDAPGGGGGNVQPSNPSYPAGPAASGGLPTWAKWLIGLIILGGVGALGWTLLHKPGSKEHRRLAHHAKAAEAHHRQRAKRHRALARQAAKEERRGRR